MLSQWVLIALLGATLGVLASLAFQRIPSSRRFNWRPVLLTMLDQGGRAVSTLIGFWGAFLILYGFALLQDPERWRWPGLSGVVDSMSLYFAVAGLTITCVTGAIPSTKARHLDTLSYVYIFIVVIVTGTIVSKWPSIMDSEIKNQFIFGISLWALSGSLSRALKMIPVAPEAPPERE